jgi:hypothetical protein
MKIHMRFIAAVSLLAICNAPINAQSGGSFNIPRSTIDSGGGTSTGGAFALTGTAGQADAGTASGGNFQLRSGFWIASSNNGGSDQLFRNGFE